MNLRSIPGTKYKIGANFSNQEMPHDSPFRVSWWYRTEFEIPADAAGKTLWLNFNGINYRADIWVNGQKLAGTNGVAGRFRRCEFGATKFLLPGNKNAIAVAVFAPEADELGITWVDWNPTPPDKDMGLWGDVSLAMSGPVATRNLQVDSKVDQPDPAVAHLAISAELHNVTDRVEPGTLRGTIGNEISFAKTVRLEAKESRVIISAPEQVSALNIADPKLWWPYRMARRTYTTCAWNLPPRKAPHPKRRLSILESMRSLPN